MRSTKSWRIALLAAMLIVTAGVAVAQTSAQPKATDPVVRDVVDMLQAGIAPSEIMEWLEAGPHHPAQLSAADLAALTAAGAPDRLVARLNALAQTGTSELPTMPPGLPTTTAPQVGGPLPPPGPPAPTPTPTTGAVAPEDRDGELATPVELPLDLIVHFRPQARGALVGWDLIAYVDGQYAARVAAARPPLVPQGAEVSVGLAPGHHVLRLLAERHVLGEDGTTWTNYARVCPVPVFLEITPGDAGTLEIWVGGPEAAAVMPGGDLRWELRRGETVLSEHGAAAAAPSGWPQLCEDAATRAASTTEGALPPGCLSWEALWPGVASVPDRATVRQLLADDLYRPEENGG